MTTALEGSEGSASRPGRSLPQERHSTHCTGGWMGPRAGLDRCGKSDPQRDSIPGPSRPYPVAIPTMLPGPQHWLRVFYFENFGLFLSSFHPCSILIFHSSTLPESMQHSNVPLAIRLCLTHFPIVCLLLIPLRNSS
jgi:hypothetical protein